MPSPTRTLRNVALAGFAATLLGACATAPSSGPMGFFVTSVGLGKGADLGGLAGADAHCKRLATGVGAGQRNWRAYLSNSAVGNDVAAVHARNRIGAGPWFNAKGMLIARDVAQLHANTDTSSGITKATALDERGQTVKGRGDTPNEHDILTGSRIDGTAFSPAYNQTCSNWTGSGDGQAMTGHHDRIGPVTDAWALSWNSSHQTRGCGQEALKATGGAGLFYCFAAD